MSDRPLIVIYIITVCFVLSTAWCGWRLREIAEHDNLVRAVGYKVWNDESDLPVLRDKLALSMTPQLECLNKDLADTFKKDTSGYPLNAFRYTFKAMVNMNLVLGDIAVVGANYSCKAYFGTNRRSSVTLNLVKKEDGLWLASIDNLCPLYEILNCVNKVQAK
jgi:hypothetical protein